MSINKYFGKIPRGLTILGLAGTLLSGCMRDNDSNYILEQERNQRWLETAANIQHAQSNMERSLVQELIAVQTEFSNGQYSISYSHSRALRGKIDNVMGDYMGSLIDGDKIRELEKMKKELRRIETQSIGIPDKILSKRQKF